MQCLPFVPPPLLVLLQKTITYCADALRSDLRWIWGTIMYSEVCVSHSVHRGGWDVTSFLATWYHVLSKGLCSEMWYMVKEGSGEGGSVKGRCSEGG